MKEQKYQARRDEHLAEERMIHNSMHRDFGNLRDNLAMEHLRHSHRIEHEKAMHDMHGRKHSR